MTRVCGWLDTHRAELVADFQSLYGLNILDVIYGSLSARYVIELIPALMQDHRSRFRARWLAEHPAPAGGNTDLSFLGFSQDSALLIAIHNAIISGYGKKARKSLLDGPKGKAVRKLFARTIADFDTNRFMGIINGG